MAKNIISGCSHIRCVDWPGYTEAVIDNRIRRLLEIGIRVRRVLKTTGKRWILR